MVTEWDYTDLASSYDRRADYSAEAVAELLSQTGLTPGCRVADIGAGTGKLTKLLLDEGLTVLAVEPNDAMRSLGVANTLGRAVTWHVGVAEETGLPPASVQMVTFGSSFSVADRTRALVESARILERGGWFVCLWNHRDLNDELQARVEATIKRLVPGYCYGERREDQAPVIASTGLFKDVRRIVTPFVATTSAEDYILAWRSHGTLYRQTGERFPYVIEKIAEVIHEHERLLVPFATVVWYCQVR